MATPPPTPPTPPTPPPTREEIRSIVSDINTLFNTINQLEERLALNESVKILKKTVQEVKLLPTEIGTIRFIIQDLESQFQELWSKYRDIKRISDATRNLQNSLYSPAPGRIITDTWDTWDTNEDDEPPTQTHRGTFEYEDETEDSEPMFHQPEQSTELKLSELDEKVALHTDLLASINQKLEAGSFKEVCRIKEDLNAKTAESVELKVQLEFFMSKLQAEGKLQRLMDLLSDSVEESSEENGNVLSQNEQGVGEELVTWVQCPSGLYEVPPNCDLSTFELENDSSDSDLDGSDDDSPRRYAASQVDEPQYSDIPKAVTESADPSEAGEESVNWVQYASGLYEVPPNSDFSLFELEHDSSDPDLSDSEDEFPMEVDLRLTTAQSDNVAETEVSWEERTVLAQCSYNEDEFSVENELAVLSRLFPGLDLGPAVQETLVSGGNRQIEALFEGFFNLRSI
ncbi:hypothetical protein WMY93_000298 [Mugilogobius chulae]|uniref:Uncharacterized protein n=1 Tax=Mugilogobius chulae TaxID=88201 RepID=A0AAW0Q8Y6_9GOBI